MKTCLIIIDVQNDFCPGGSLAVPEADRIIPLINKISSGFDKVVATQDWHPSGHVSFAKTHKKEPYETVTQDNIVQVLWPDHCVQGSAGADLHPELDLKGIDLILRKGTDPLIDSYSAFLENDKRTETGLRYYLKGLKINEVYLCGLATDYCVYFSAMDSKSMGFSTFVVLDACRGVDVPPGHVKKVLEEMKKKGIKIIDHESLSA